MFFNNFNDFNEKFVAQQLHATDFYPFKCRNEQRYFGQQKIFKQSLRKILFCQYQNKIKTLPV